MDVGRSANSGECELLIDWNFGSLFDETFAMMSVS